MNWVKLEKGNAWGSIYYALPGSRLAGGYAACKNGVKLVEGKRYSFRLPHLSLADGTLVSRPHHETIQDMGRSYHASSKLLGFELNYFGLKFFVEVSEVELLEADLT